MPRITKLFWDANGNNVDHLWERRVTVDDIDEIVFGVPGEEPNHRLLRDGEYYLLFGETGNGRLLKVVGEFIENGTFRPFGAIDMDDNEKRKFRNRG